MTSKSKYADPAIKANTSFNALQILPKLIEYIECHGCHDVVFSQSYKSFLGWP